MPQTLSFILIILLAFAEADELGNEICKVKLQGILIPRYADNVTDTLALKVVFDDDKEVKCGNFLNVNSTVSAPTITYDVKGACNEATILFIDVLSEMNDVDGYPYRHWLTNNVPADVLKQGFYGQSGDVMTDYIHPADPYSDHNYIFLVYCQEEHIKTETSKDELVLKGPSFQVKKYAEKNKLGNPVAANYFASTHTDWESYP